MADEESITAAIAAVRARIDECQRELGELSTQLRAARLAADEALPRAVIVTTTRREGRQLREVVIARRTGATIFTRTAGERASEQAWRCVRGTWREYPANRGFSSAHHELELADDPAGDGDAA